MQTKDLQEQGAGRARVGTLLWTACLQFFVAEQVVRLAWTLPYSFRTNYVSDLGASVCSGTVCSPWHTLMNTSFLLQGVLIAGGAILTWKQYSPVRRTGLGLLQVCGLGVIVVGLVPENADPGLHRFGAALHFLGGGLGMIAFGSTIRRWFGGISVAAGIAVLAAVVQLGQGGGTWGHEIGIGALERIPAYGIAGWMTVLGVRGYRRHRKGFRASRRSRAISGITPVRSESPAPLGRRFPPR